MVSAAWAILVVKAVATTTPAAIECLTGRLKAFFMKFLQASGWWKFAHTSKIVGQKPYQSAETAELRSFVGSLE
jgi:hypothetical protein